MRYDITCTSHSPLKHCHTKPLHCKQPEQPHLTGHEKTIQQLPELQLNLSSHHLINLLTPSGKPTHLYKWSISMLFPTFLSNFTWMPCPPLAFRLSACICHQTLESRRSRERILSTPAELLFSPGPILSKWLTGQSSPISPCACSSYTRLEISE